MTQRAELVADRQDVVLLVGRERDVVQARAVPARHRGVVDGGLAAHPRGVGGAGLVLDVLGHAEPEVLQVGDGPGHVGRDLVEVVDADERAGRVQVVAPREPLDVLDLVEELVGEPERVLDAHRVPEALHEAVRPPLDPAPELVVERDGPVEVLGGADPVGERGDRRHRPRAQDEVVVDELLVAAQVDDLVVLLGHDEPEDVDVEVPRRGEVGDDELHGRGAQDVRRRGRRRRDGGRAHVSVLCRRSGCAPRRA